MKRKINSLLFLVYLAAGCFASGARSVSPTAEFSWVGINRFTGRCKFSQSSVFMT